MKPVQQPTDWQSPVWHPDLGDAQTEFDSLRALAQKVLVRKAGSEVVLHTPEPGLIYIEFKGLPTAVEVYMVSKPLSQTALRFAIYKLPTNGDESEVYAEDVDTALQAIVGNDS